MLAVESPGQVAGHKSVDDLDGAPLLGVLHHLQHAVLDHDIVQIEGLKFLNGDLGDELRVGILLGVRRVEAVFILDVNHGAGAENLADKVDPGIGAVRRDAADGRVGLPVDVGRHAEENHRAPLLQVEGELGELRSAR